MINRCALFLLSFISYVLIASEFTRPIDILPESFLKEYWYNLDRYCKGTQFICLPGNYVYQEAERWQQNSICSITPYNYSAENYDIKKYNVQIDECRLQYKSITIRLEKEEKNQEGIIERLNQRIIQTQNDIGLFYQEKEILIQKLQCIINDYRVIIAKKQREYVEKLEIFDDEITMYKIKINELEEKIKERKVAIKLQKNIISLDKFFSIIKKTDATRDELHDIVFLQSLIASYSNADNTTHDMLLKKLPFYQYYIFALGLFFKWYMVVDDIRENTLLHETMRYFIENTRNDIEYYKKSYFSIIFDGLKQYETYVTLRKNAKNKFQKQIRLQAIQDILLLLKPFKNTEIFNELYYKKKECCKNEGQINHFMLNVIFYKKIRLCIMIFSLFWFLGFNFKTKIAKA